MAVRKQTLQQRRKLMPREFMTEVEQTGLDKITKEAAKGEKRNKEKYNNSIGISVIMLGCKYNLSMLNKER